MNKKDYYWAKYMLIFGFFCICFGTSIFLKTEHAPDEAMRMLIQEYIVSHNTLLFCFVVSVFAFSKRCNAVSKSFSVNLGSHKKDAM